MKIRQLQYFLIVAEEQNFTRAASRVHIQQSPLSRAMRDLEHELGVALFERSKGRIRLTRSGEVFYEETRRLLFFLNNARARAQAAANGFRGHLRIALTDGLAQPHITELLATCRAEEPLTEIRILEMAVSEMVPALNSDQIDAGLTLHTEFETEQYVIDNVWTDILTQLRKEGFEPFMVCQTRVRHDDRRDFTKHMIRLRHASQINGAEANEIILLNSHDGTSSYQMLAGMFRFVCHNGLVCGDTLADKRIPHKGNVAEHVIEGAYEVLQGFQQVHDTRDAMRSVSLHADEAQLPAPDPDEVMPKNLQALATLMRQHYSITDNAWEKPDQARQQDHSQPIDDVEEERL